MSQEMFQNYINGQWVGSSAVIENINPSDTSDVVGHYAKASPEDCLAAIAAANAAFDGWSQSGLEQRKQILDFIGAELIARSGEIGEYWLVKRVKPALKALVKCIALASSFNTMVPKRCA